MDISIRQILLSDLDVFYEFFQKAIAGEFPEYSAKTQDYIFNRGWSKQVYENWLKNNQRYIVGAWSGDKLVAILDAQMPYLGVCFCSWLVVDCMFQRKGIGSKLLAEMEKVMKEKDAHMLYLYSGQGKVPFYKKVGYEWVGVMKKSWFGQDHHVFTKLLSEPVEENFLK